MGNLEGAAQIWTVDDQGLILSKSAWFTSHELWRYEEYLDHILDLTQPIFDLNNDGILGAPQGTEIAESLRLM